MASLSHDSLERWANEPEYFAERVRRPRPSVLLKRTGTLVFIIGVAWFGCMPVIVDRIWSAAIEYPASNWVDVAGYVVWYAVFLVLCFGGLWLWGKGASRSSRRR